MNHHVKNNIHISVALSEPLKILEIKTTGLLNSTQLTSTAEDTLVPPYNPPPTITGSIRLSQNCSSNRPGQVASSGNPGSSSPLIRILRPAWQPTPSSWSSPPCSPASEPHLGRWVTIASGPTCTFVNSSDSPFFQMPSYFYLCSPSNKNPTSVPAAWVWTLSGRGVDRHQMGMGY